LSIRETIGDVRCRLGPARMGAFALDGTTEELVPPTTDGDTETLAPG